MYNYLKQRFLKFRRSMKHHVHKAVKEKSSPHSIALGFAIGSFIGIFPTGGFGLLFALLIMLLFKTLNKIAVFAGVAVWNPLTMIPIYYASYKLGDIILHNTPDVMQYKTVALNQAFDFSERYLTGNIIIAVGISALSYFIMKKAVIIYRERKERKLKEKSST